jgi:hypothetical protein
VPSGTAHAPRRRPEILTREQWGADESIRRGTPDYTSTVKVGFVHHTASSNDYTAAQAAAMVRGIYAYHVKSNGWSDIGYNVLVDRYGRAYEGRAGGIDRYVLGAHTGGFNVDSFGVSLLGDFSTGPAVRHHHGDRLKVLAWKLGLGLPRPRGQAVLTSGRRRHLEVPGRHAGHLRRRQRPPRRRRHQLPGCDDVRPAARPALGRRRGPGAPTW